MWDEVALCSFLDLQPCTNKGREEHPGSIGDFKSIPALSCGIGSSGSSALLGRSASEYGTLCHGDGAHEGGDRYRRVLMLAILSSAERAASVSRYCHQVVTGSAAC